MTGTVADQIDLFKKFSDDESFRRWLSEMLFAATYNPAVASASGPRQ